MSIYWRCLSDSSQPSLGRSKARLIPQRAMLSSDEGDSHQEQVQMPDQQLIQVLYARQTLEEITAGLRKQDDLPAASDLGTLVQAQKLIEQGKASEARDVLTGVMKHAEESRVRLWAGKALCDLGFQPTGSLARQALGVVFEVPMEESSDILAVYRDNTVRFFSYGGGMFFYEPAAEAPALDQLCQKIISVANRIAQSSNEASLSDEPDAPHITILTVSGETPVGAKGTDALLGLGAQIIGVLDDLRQ